MDSKRTGPLSGSRKTGYRIAVLASFSGQGGVERMLINLMEGILNTGCCSLDLLRVKAEGPYAALVPEGCRIIDLPSSHSLTCIRPLARYLRRWSPDGLLAAKDRVARAAVIAKSLSGARTRLVLRLGTNLSASLRNRSLGTKVLRYLPSRILYPRAEAIVAVSRGVAQDTSTITGIPLEGIRTIANPVITARLFSLALESADHPWIGQGKPPLLVAAGRLTQQKDFFTLIQALAQVRKQREARLIILGEGRLRPALERRIAELNLEACVDLPGFVSNPYPFLAAADLFVLSSAWEGSPNVLTEALALGRPVVATDCPSGPREILQDGVIAPLVPVGDARAMAQAVLQVLKAPPGPACLQEAVDGYRAETSAREYLKVLIPGLELDQRAAGCAGGNAGRRNHASVL